MTPPSSPSCYSLLFLALILAASGCAGHAAGTKILVDAASTATAPDGSAQKPFATIGDALKVARPGDTVAVRAGIYREVLRLPSGAPGAPLTLMAEPGQRVVLSGFVPIAGWQPYKDKIFTTTVDWKPTDIYVAMTRQPIAHQPNEGWYTIRDVNDKTVTDVDKLKGLPNLVGGHLQVFQRKGIVFFNDPIVEQDPAGSLTVNMPSKWQTLAKGDCYVIKNRPELIDLPGEWAVEAQPDGKTYKLYFWPPNAGALKNVQGRRVTRNLIGGRGVHDVKIDGLEIAGCEDNGLEIGAGSSDVTITNCLAHNNGGTGFFLRGVKNITLSHSRSLANYTGIGVASANAVTIEANEVAYNLGDGIDVAGDISGRYGTPNGNPADVTNDVTLRRNYVHHHGLWGHPDNLQLYRGVRGIKFVDNLALGGGQGLMTEEVDGGELTGNVFLSSAAYLIIFGHGNSNDWTMKRNTFGLPGYGVYSFTGKKYQADENVYLGGVTTHATYTGDKNLYTVGFDSKASPGQDANSVRGLAEFVSVPKGHGVVTFDDANTAETLKVRARPAEWKVGDVVEINWDGIARKITAIEGQNVSFTPALPAKPISNFALVVNWGDKTDLLLDTRLKPNSPGANMSAEGGPIGSTISIPAFRKYDFDGDGQPDLAPLPEDVKAGLPNPNNLIPPSF